MPFICFAAIPEAPSQTNLKKVLDNYYIQNAPTELITGTVIPFSFTSYPPSADFSTTESTLSGEPYDSSYICQLEFPPGTTDQQMEEYIKTNQFWVWFFFLSRELPGRNSSAWYFGLRMVFYGRSFMIKQSIFRMLSSIPETDCQLKLCHFLYILLSVINSCSWRVFYCSYKQFVKLLA